MEIRRGLMMQMSGDRVPSYLKHFTFTPNENIRSIQLNVGEIYYAVLTSNCPKSGLLVDTVSNGIINIDPPTGFYGNISRLATRKANDTVGYFVSTSANQEWEYADGVLTIGCTSGWWFGEGITYDLFCC